MRFRNIMLVVTLATLVASAPARAQHAPETISEYFGMCVEGAYKEFKECTSEGGFLWDLGCAIVYVIDFWVCAITSPPEYVIKSIK